MFKNIDCIKLYISNEKILSRVPDISNDCTVDIDYVTEICIAGRNLHAVLLEINIFMRHQRNSHHAEIINNVSYGSS